MNTGLVLPFLVESGLITYRDVTQGGIKVRQGQASTAPIHAPLPSLYTSAIIIYGGLSLMPSSFAPIPQLIGWGFVVATLLNLYTPGSAVLARSQNAAAVQGLTTAPPAPPKAA